MISHHYVWFAWSVAFLVFWGIIFAVFRDERRKMWQTSFLTMLFGLTEPLFVPRYWNPPSLFDLAQRTGFDVESLIFCFAIGGTSAVLYDLLTGRRSMPMPEAERHLPIHRHHLLALTSPFMAFLMLVFLPWNPIYPGIIAMGVGAISTILCRPDLKTRTWVGGGLFLVYYSVLLEGLGFSSPGYIERVWNLPALLGIKFFGMPIEELLFAVCFGMYWSGVYEHLTWRATSLLTNQGTPARGSWI
jgi:Lycopene cyclase